MGFGLGGLTRMMGGVGSMLEHTVIEDILD